MNFCEVYINIINPIICAIIGGLFTYIGVRLTIKNENKKQKEEKRLSNKPLIYRIDPMQEYDSKHVADYILNSDNKGKNYRIVGIIKNTDNAIAIIEYVSIKGKKFYPKNGNVIDKNIIFNLCIYVDEKPKENDEIILTLKDILDNKYEYKLDIDINWDDNQCLINGWKEI